MHGHRSSGEVDSSNSCAVAGGSLLAPIKITTAYISKGCAYTWQLLMTDGDAVNDARSTPAASA